jgi:hypothetical protein
VGSIVGRASTVVGHDGVADGVGEPPDVHAANASKATAAAETRTHLDVMRAW